MWPWGRRDTEQTHEQLLASSVPATGPEQPAPHTSGSTVAVAGPALPGTVSCCKAGGHWGRTMRPMDPGVWVDEGDMEAAR